MARPPARRLHHAKIDIAVTVGRGPSRDAYGSNWHSEEGKMLSWLVSLRTRCAGSEIDRELVKSGLGRLRREARKPGTVGPRCGRSGRES